MSISHAESTVILVCLAITVTGYTPSSFMDDYLTDDSYANVYYKRSPIHKFTTYDKKAPDFLPETSFQNMGGDYGWIF